MTPVYQFDGSPLASKNCFAAEGAMLVAMATGGKKRPTASEFRSHVYNLDGYGNPTTRDVTGGGRPSQIVETAKRAYGVHLDYGVLPFADALRLGERSDVMVGHSISYAPVAGTRFDGSPGFRGLHGVGRSGGQVYDPLADGRRSGIPTAPDRWPVDLLMRACALYADTGMGRATVVIAYAPKVTPKRYSVKFEPGAIFLYTPLNGQWVRVRADGVSKATSAPCSAPETVPWLSGRKRLVKMTAGKYDGHWVEPTASHMELVAHA